MITEIHIEQALKELFDHIEFTKEPVGLYDPLRYMIAIGGKRIRPRLCLTTFGLYKDTFDPSILQPAAALEVFHSFTLIHDDIMDRSPLRRGVPTVWKKWNEDTAILSGDVMNIDAYKRIACAPANVLPQVLKLFSGCLMVALSVVMIAKPALMNELSSTLIVFGAAVAVTLVTS